jgi:tRNA pseudouridine55 synthase
MTLEASKANWCGAIPLWKPAGYSSREAAKRISRHFSVRDLGHVGTLDPAAEGVLPLLVGKATRLQDYLLETAKSYTFDVEFGVETTTLDSEGEVCATGTVPNIDESTLQAVVETFKGSRKQTPPLYSAVKFKGRELYKYARSTESESQDVVPLEDLARDIVVHQLTFEFSALPLVRFHVTCSKGTYVRCLARDIAYALGTFATVRRLIRTQSSGFSESDCLRLESLEQYAQLSDVLIPMEKFSINLPVFQVNDIVAIQKIMMGQEIPVNENTDASRGVILADNLGKYFGLGIVHFRDNEPKVRLKRGLR